MENVVMEGDWRYELLAQYPHLFAKYARPQCGDGWRSLIGLTLRRISEAMEGHEKAALQITSVAEKYGTLRVEYSAVRLPASAIETIERAVAIAEAISEHTCETCGAPGRLYDDGGRFSASCAAHAKGSPLTGNEEDA
jgi:hypothetical protein